MKKLHLLVGIIGVGVVINMAADVKYPRLTANQGQEVEAAQYYQRDSAARSSTYKLIDALIKEKKECVGEATVDWPAIFRILDSMRGDISVNEYSTFDFQYPLLWIAVKDGNLLIAKTLLEKYKASPNFLTTIPYSDGQEFESMSPLMFACKKGNIAMINLLLKHKANPNLKNEQGKNSFDYAQNAEVLAIINKSKK